MSYKNSAADLTAIAMAVVVLGIVVTIGATILVNIRDSHVKDLSTFTTTNESLSFTNSKTNLANLGTGTVTITNQTTGATVAAPNYTVSVGTDGTITITNLTSTWQPWYSTYTTLNTSSRQDYVIANKSAIGIGEFGNWFKIIVIVGVAAVILALIFGAFGKGSTGQSSSGGY